MVPAAQQSPPRGSPGAGGALAKSPSLPREERPRLGAELGERERTGTGGQAGVASSVLVPPPRDRLCPVPFPPGKGKGFGHLGVQFIPKGMAGTALGKEPEAAASGSVMGLSHGGRQFSLPHLSGEVGIAGINLPWVGPGSNLRFSHPEEKIPLLYIPFHIPPFPELLWEATTLKMEQIPGKRSRCGAGAAQSPASRPSARQTGPDSHRDHRAGPGLGFLGRGGRPGTLSAARHLLGFLESKIQLETPPWTGISWGLDGVLFPEQLPGGPLAWWHLGTWGDRGTWHLGVGMDSSGKGGIW